uniref:Signal-induced proliferation-associated 1 n=1 Tax=Catharus ustulatus TaxID=91951 RepID=A0A8C3V149_CATUS
AAIWGGGRGGPRGGFGGAMQSDDLFLRKMRGPLARPPLSTTPPVTIGGGIPSPPPSPGAAAPRQRSSSEAALGRPPEDGEGSPRGASPRSRSQSHEEAAGGGSSLTPPRFRDPLLLLGLPGGDGEGGDPDSFPRPPWSPLLAHYDVQSILFDPTEPPPGPPSLISGASAAHLEPEEPPGTPGVAPDPEALVLSCPRFCCETGGEQELGLGSHRGPPGPGQLPNAAVAVLEEPPAGARPPHPIEHSDEGAEYYRKYFYGKEHQNLLGEDPRLGPVAVSLRREEKEGARPQVLHRIILRTCQARTLRGSVLEESLPPGCRPPGARGVPPRKLLELLLPGLAVGGLRLAPSPAVQETLLKLDEQGVSRQRKVGVLYCRAGQGSEEEMYNNEGPGPALEQFLTLLGTRVRLRGFGGYRAQLDTRTDSTGTHSLYTTYHGYELMFHVSTMLPFTPRNRQQLLRKRHIGNDIVTIVFQEPGALPFSPRALRSHFQHVFIVVRVHEPCTPNTSYSVAVVRPDDTPPFGPPLAEGQRFWGGSGLRPFLLAKAINGENAAARGGYLLELLRLHGGGRDPGLAGGLWGLSGGLHVPCPPPQAVTRGCEAQELALPRGAGGRRGFRVDPSGVVTAVTRFSFAETAGLRPGARLLRVGRRPLPRGDPRRLRELLRRPSGPLTLLGVGGSGDSGGLRGELGLGELGGEWGGLGDSGVWGDLRGSRGVWGGMERVWGLEGLEGEWGARGFGGNVGSEGLGGFGVVGRNVRGERFGEFGGNGGEWGGLGGSGFGGM